MHYADHIMRDVQTAALDQGLAEHPWLAVATVCLGAAMAAIDASIVTVGLPTMQHYFHTTSNDIAWVSLTYLLALTTIVVLAGRLADSVGRSRMYRFGFVVFGIASAGCGLAPSLWVLLLSRVVQGVGAAMLQANSVAIVTSSVPARMRGRAIGIQGAAQAIGLTIGPTIGGFLIGAFSWQAIFLVNLPIAAVALIVAPFTLPHDARREAGQGMPKVDVTSSLLLAVSLTLLLLAMKGHGIWYIELLAGLVAGYFFTVRQLRIEQPLVHPSVVRIIHVTGGVVLGVLSFSVLYGVLFLAPYYFQRVRGLPTAHMGIIVSAVALAMTAVAPVAGTLADRFGNRLVAVAGLIVTAIGSLMMFLWTKNVAFGWTVPALVLIGFGAGVFTPPNNSSVMGHSPEEHLGVTGGLLNMGRSIGMTAGIAVAAAMYSLAANDPFQGFRNAALALLIIAAASIVLQAVLPKETHAGMSGMPFLPD
jgi:EmrB/QacA subfamily drug resistance transporter